MKKRIIILTLTLVMLLCLCACGGNKPAETAPSQPSAEPAATEAPPVQESSAEENAAEEAAEPADLVNEAYEKALALKDHDVQELYDAIGEPESSDYASSCLVDGEDGALYYNGFTVYTLKTADGETVYDAELN